MIHPKQLHDSMMYNWLYNGRKAKDEQPKENLNFF